MPRNVEIKARIRDLQVMRRLVAGIAAGAPLTLQQTDTFFGVVSGRLKLRERSDGPAELIYYDRPDEVGPSESRYQCAAVAEPKAVRDLLGSALGVRGQVRKRRTVYMVGRTRIHLDEVAGLGAFLELEVVLGEGERAEAGAGEARRLMGLLGITEDALVPEAYVDLLPGRPRGGRGGGR